MTKSVAHLIYAVGLISVIVSQLLLKSGMLRLASDSGAASKLELFRAALSTPTLWFGGLALVTGAACWYISMIRLPLSFMMPMASLIAPTVSIAAWAIYNEPLTPPMLAAIGLITVGALWLGWLNA